MRESLYPRMRGKIFLIGAMILLWSLAPPVQGDVFLVDPVVQKAKAGSVLNVGNISPGEKLEIIFNTDSGYGKEAPWLQAELGQPTPSGIQVSSSQYETKSLITSVQTSALTPEGIYGIPLTMSGNQTLLQNETYTIKLGIKKRLVSGSLAASHITGKVNEPLIYTILLVNDSSTKVPIRVEPNLPFTWTQGKNMELKPHTFEEMKINVTPRFAGPKTFDIKIIRTDNGITVDQLEGILVANPNLADRYSAGLYGFPFFTISLVADYLTNAFFSYLL